MTIISKNIIKACCILFLFLVAIGCSEERNEQLIARIGNKTISLNEFIRRAEYTVRPNYCRSNTNLAKKVILNSLIAEKILSIEAEKENEIQNSKSVKKFLKGRKEQAMRQILYKKEITDNVKLDNDLIKRVSKFVTRDYDISYVSLTDSFVVNQLREEFFDFNFSWEKNLSENYSLEKIPNRIVSWNNVENYQILDLLYTQDIKKDSIYGPLKFADNHYMYLKVNNWTTLKVFTESQKRQNIEKIEDVYNQRYSRIIFEDYIRSIMKNREIEFNSEIFFDLADLMGPIYMKSLSEKKDIFKKGVWVFDKEQKKYDNLKPSIEQISSKILYRLEGKSYTVSQFLEELKTHPLVFRKKKFPKNEFGFQLQMAIIDQVRDSFLTKVAYDNKFDQRLEVIRDNIMWSDYLNSVFQKYTYLQSNNADSLFAVDNNKVIDDVLNPYVDSLQQLYSDKISINIELFNSVNLSNIDMSVIYRGVPYSIVVPSFPLLTTDYQLDYGKVSNNLN